MAYADLRQFLARLEAEGELARVKAEVDVNYEIGAICRKALDHKGPALVFDNIKDCSIPLLTNVFATRKRYAIAIETVPEDIHREWIKRTSGLVEPKLVNAGPCKENILTGDEVDLLKFPTPIWNEIDGGPFITFACYISKDPQTGERNVGMYRGQVHDRRRLGILAPPFRHISIHRDKVENQRFPVALAIGVDPSIYLSTVAPFPYGVDELSMAGALRGEPVELVKCETIPVEVPATAEIVLEGEMLPGVLKDEGPFGEFTGYYGGPKDKRPVIEIRAITHRDNPINVGCYVGRPPTHGITNIPTEALIMRDVPVPGVKKMYLPEGGANFVGVVSIEKYFEGYGKMVGAAVLGTWASYYIKILIVVDEDIDPSDGDAVQWALATRVQPHRDVDILKDVTGMNLDPSLPELEKLTGHARTSKMIIDATKHDAREFPLICRPKKEVMEKVEKEWEKYGIKLERD